jgi:sigma-B regulation protein RsbU (phosphoserine phosphatase)
VKHAFNIMTSKITALMDESHQKGVQESQIKLAKKVQEMTLPPENVEIAQHRLHSFVEFADECGGDFWGVVEPKAPGSPMVVMIGDATGHGIPSALLTASVRGALSILSQWMTENPQAAMDPRSVLNHFNRTVFETAQGAIEMTFFAAVLDLKEGYLLAANAAHPAPFLLSGGKISSVAFGTSTPLGGKKDTQYNDFVTIPWKAGDKLVMYSDGLVDVYQGDKNLFDRKALRQFLDQNAKADSKVLLKRLMDTRRHLAPNTKAVDDVTVVVCEAKA